MGLAGLAVDQNVNIAPLVGDQGEPTIAVDPADTNDLFAAWNTNTGVPGPNFVGLYGAYSVDGGKTWHARNIATGADGLPQAWSDPSVAFDQFGNLFITYLDISQNAIDLGWSTNGGQSFSTLAQVPGGTDQPTVATGPGGLLDNGTTSPGAVWVSYLSSTGNMAAFGAAISGSGAILGPAAVSFITAPIQVPGSNPGNFGDIAVGPLGQVVVAFQRTGTGAGPSTIFTSENPLGLRAARAFQAAPVEVLTTNVGDLTPLNAYPYRAGRLAGGQPGVGIDAETGLAFDLSNGPNRGRLYLVYTTRSNVNPTNWATTIDVVYSDQDGQTTASWSSPVLVTDSGNSNSEFFPRIAVDDSSSDPGTVAVSWLDARNDPNDQAVEEYAAVSVDGGSEFSANEQIAAAPSDAVAIADPNQFGDYMGLTFYGGSFYPIWADNSNSTGDNPNPNNPSPALAQYKRSSDIYTARVTLLGAGTYTVSEVEQPGWTQTDPGGAGTHVVTLAAGQTVTGVNFGNFQDPVITGQAFWDLAGNGVNDPGDPALSGWTIRLSDSTGVIATTTTDSSGNYVFTVDAPNNYTISEQVPTGWRETLPATPGTYTVTVADKTSGETYASKDFGNIPVPSTISGTVYNDLNDDGKRDTGDPGLAGLTVFLDLHGDGILHPDDPKAVTDGNGNYGIVVPATGVYHVREVLPQGFTQTTSNPSAITITSLNGPSFGSVNFGNFVLGTISGEVFRQETDSPRGAAIGLLGWTVYIDSNGDGKLEPGDPTAVTDSDGFYQFTGLAAGTYTIREVLMPGYLLSSPAASAGSSYKVTLSASGTIVQDQNFGNALGPNPIVESLTPNVTTIADAQVGSATFKLSIIYSDVMNSAVAPTINFSPSVSSTLTFASGSWDLTDTVYTAFYNVASASVGVSGVAVTITGTRMRMATLSSVSPKALRLPSAPSGSFLHRLHHLRHLHRLHRLPW